jgi:hypothetical protein
LRATSSGCRQAWPAAAEAGGLAPGPGVELADADGPGDPDRRDGDPDELADCGPDDAGAEPDGDPEGPADGDPEGPADGDPEGPADGDPEGPADVLGWAGGADCVQAAMITRLLAGSALPPTPPRSTK